MYNFFFLLMAKWSGSAGDQRALKSNDDLGMMNGYSVGITVTFFLLAKGA